MFGVDVPFCEAVDREVAEVGGDDDLSAGLDRCGEDVSIIEVRKLEPFDERLVAEHQTIPHSPKHQLPGACQRSRVEVGPIPVEVGEHFIEDLVSPLGLDQPGLRDADQQVPQRAWIQHAGVVDHDERHWLTPDPCPA